MLPALQWDMPPRELALPGNEVHVWQALLDLEQNTYRQLEPTLSEDERGRAARFRFDSDRKHFVAARAILRDLLGRYLGESPAAIEFSYGPQGKPSLRRQGSTPPLSFNLSHSHGLSLFAFSRGREVGIDLEWIRPDFSTGEIAERFFSKQEVAEFLALPPEQKPEGFFLCWTRKEAYIKAKGAGLQIPLDSFSVSLIPGRPETLQSSDGQRWGLRSFQPAPNFAAAVVGEGQAWQLRSATWAPRS